jgi:hypothetical protein
MRVVHHKEMWNWNKELVFKLPMVRAWPSSGGRKLESAKLECKRAPKAWISKHQVTAMWRRFVIHFGAGGGAELGALVPGTVGLWLNLVGRWLQCTAEQPMMLHSMHPGSRGVQPHERLASHNDQGCL